LITKSIPLSFPAIFSSPRPIAEEPSQSSLHLHEFRACMRALISFADNHRGREPCARERAL
jgi:hypothetical protein